MKQNVLHLLILLFFVSLSYSFKNNKKINKCLTKKKSRGYCREEGECVGANEPLLPENCPANFICCPVRKVSRTKCYEYSKYVFAESLMHPGLHDDIKPELADECGISGVPLMTAGELVNAKEFPHMAALGYKGPKGSERTWDCGGSLISERYVLTTAHCCSKRNPPKVVKLGVINTNSNGTYVELRQVQKVIIHPKYEQKSGVNYNDIALLRMDKKVDFTPYVRPACLDYKGHVDKERSVLALGYGVASNAGPGKSDLMKAVLDIIDEESCTKRWKKIYKGDLPRNKFCAGSLHFGSDTCSGDSGGLLQVILERPYCMYKQMALSSSGGFCSHKHSIYLYTRVFSYIPWIESVVWPGEN